MHGDIASSTEDDQVLVLVIAIVADGALGVLLDYQSTLVGAQRVVALNVQSVRAIAIGVISTLR